MTNIKSMNKENQNIQNILNKYFEVFPEEKNNLPILEKQLKNDENLANRKNFNGHITVTGYILNKSKNKLLLIHNIHLDIWIWTGWHYEEDDKDLIACVTREIIEETWLRDFELDSRHLDNNIIPVNLKTFPIPPNPKKQEGPHYHHDFAYVFIKWDDEEDLEMQEDEIQWARWLSLDEAKKLNDGNSWEELFEKIKNLFCSNKLERNNFKD